MKILENCQPREVLRYFEEIAAIPHGSRNTKAISDYCMAFGAAHGLECHQDKSDNVILIKEASAGCEAAEPLILQGHIDMVCEKAPGCTINMEKEGLHLVVNGDEVYAEGTTLGGDDGIAVAMILALLADDTLPHPRLEAVLTSDEEIGMLGAVELDVSPLKGRRLLNLDSEDEGIFTVSCAGGNLTCCHLPLAREKVTGRAVALTVGGLVGGHSGAEIDKGRASANILMGRLLEALRAEMPFRLIEVNGGQKDNAITRESTALLLAEKPEALADFAARWQEIFRHEYRATEPELWVRAEAGEEKVWDAMTADCTARAAALLLLAPGGIQTMSNDLPGLVQTSLNLGILKTEEKELTASFCVRSSMPTEKEMLAARLGRLATLLGGTAEISGDYPAWEVRADSDFRALMVEIFKEQYGHEPRVEAIHAGLECGVFCGKLPGVDCISLGPDMKDVHTPRERMYLSSLQRVWAFVQEAVRRSC